MPNGSKRSNKNDYTSCVRFKKQDFHMHYYSSQFALNFTTCLFYNVTLYIIMYNSSSRLIKLDILKLHFFFLFLGYIVINLFTFFSLCYYSLYFILIDTFILKEILKFLFQLSLQLNNFTNTEEKVTIYLPNLKHVLFFLIVKLKTLNSSNKLLVWNKWTCILDLNI